MSLRNVGESTVDILREMAELVELVPEKYWKRVNQDRKLRFFPFSGSVDVTSAIWSEFGILGSDYRRCDLKKGCRVTKCSWQMSKSRQQA